jgi:hypothetical protein
MSFVLQTLALALSGYALFRLWRLASPDERWLRVVVALGLIGRAVGGAVLFWVSWLRLPYGRSLQLGNGLWFFGLDAMHYFGGGAVAADRGLAGIGQLSLFLPSVAYTRVLAVALWMFGIVTSVAVLLNLFFYLGSVAIVQRWSRGSSDRRPFAFAIVVLSLTPSLVLWSLQPLKDVFFQFLVIAFVAACKRWQELADSGSRTRSMVGLVLLLSLLLFHIASVRWYVGFMLLGVAALFAGVLALRARTLRAVTIVVLLIVSLRTAIVHGAGPYLPVQVRPLLLMRDSGETRPAALAETVVAAREGFDRIGGASTIRAGKTTVTPPPAERATAPPPRTTTAAPAPALPGTKAAPEVEAEVRALIQRLTDTWNRRDVQPHLELYWQSPELVLSVGDRRVDGWEAFRDSVLRNPIRPTMKFEVATVDVATVETLAVDEARARGTWTVTPVNGSPAEGTFTIVARRFPTKGWLVTGRYLAMKGAPPALGPPAPPTVAAPVAPEETPSALPVHVTRLVAGAGALVVPQQVGNRLGLFEVGGGRGLVWFSDVDTLVFDAVLVFVAFVAFSRLRKAARSPLVWLTIVFALLIAGPLAYTISNWGTLFRMRAMVFTALVLIPLALAAPPPPDQKRPDPV